MLNRRSYPGEDDREGGDWGSIGERNASSQDLVTVGESIIRLSSLTDVMERIAFFQKVIVGGAQVKFKR